MANRTAPARSAVGVREKRCWPPPPSLHFDSHLARRCSWPRIVAASPRAAASLRRPVVNDRSLVDKRCIDPHRSAAAATSPMRWPSVLDEGSRGGWHRTLRIWRHVTVWLRNRPVTRQASTPQKCSLGYNSPSLPLGLPTPPLPPASPKPSPTRPRSSSRHSGLASELASGLASGLAFGLASRLASDLTSGLPTCRSCCVVGVVAAPQPHKTGGFRASPRVREPAAAVRHAS